MNEKLIADFAGTYKIAIFRCIGGALERAA